MKKNTMKIHLTRKLIDKFVNSRKYNKWGYRNSKQTILIEEFIRFVDEVYGDWDPNKDIE